MVFAMGTTKEEEAGGGLTADGTATVALSADQSPAPKSNGNISLRDAAPVAYYGIALTVGVSPCDDDELPLVFVDRTLALRCVKKYRGARFKAFASREEAAAFSMQPPVASVESTDASDSASAAAAALAVERSSNYRTPKSQDLVQLRKAIEAGDTTTFKQTVWSNPRYLVGSGDTPTILQEGYRYNALHVACAKGQPALVKILLETLKDPHFLELLFPDDSSDVRLRRTAFLLDLYLNTPDKGRCETPLHFACKFGCFEAVELLVAQPECDRNRLNKEGQTPREIICLRLPSASASLKNKMDALFEERLFVPVLRSEDHSVPPTVGEPFSPDASPVHHSPVTSPRDSLLTVMAAAGPMSPTEARSMYRQWKAPKRRSIGLKEQCSPMDNVRLADIEKGLEYVGRNLAKDMRVPWSEYWPFLGCWCNLASAEGLEKLENHLRVRRLQALSERWSLETSTQSQSDEQLPSPMSQLCEALGELKLDLPAEKSRGNVRDSHNHHLSFKPLVPKSLNGKISSPTANCGCSPSSGSQAAEKSFPLAAQRLARVLFDWALAHESGPEPEADLGLQLADQVLQELGQLERGLSKGQLWRLHPWLAREVHALLQDSLELPERQNLCRALRTQLQHWAPSPPSTDDEDEGGSDRGAADAAWRYRQPSSRKRSRALKRHLQCILRCLCALLHAGLAEDSEPFPCFCSCSQREAMGLEAAFLRDCKTQPVEEEEEEEFFTPPTSPCSSTSSGPSPDAHTPDEGPLVFLQGSQPTKLDADVLRALEPHLLDSGSIDPLLYPCVHQWMQLVCSYPAEALSRWASPSVNNARHLTHTPTADSPRSNGDTKGEACRTPQRDMSGVALRPKTLWSTANSPRQHL
ncbi:ankyrin repeat and LEM domain-containing protein 2 isoform X1 [Haemaphysalis longicornis]